MKHEELLSRARRHMWAAWQLSSEELASQAAETLIGLGMLVPEGGAQELERVRTDLAREELAYERLRVALESAKRGRRKLRSQVAVLEGADEPVDRLTRTFAPTQALREEARTEPPLLTTYRASWDSFVFGLYTTADAARQHCEAHARRDLSGASFNWIEDEEEGVSELVAAFGEDERPTGYVVTALEVASRYDPEADE
ncbi:hypothetical protein [Streptomyces sp. NPDC058335]|uniref:hypothetical protein n=1 Tax=Streptomyces sp. NPDC058335 TaxID=3346451 RepID=UPI00364F8997